MAEINVQQTVPLLLVRDLTASLGFYLDGLQFEVRHRWVPDGRIRWCWLERGTAALMLQEIAPSEHHDAPRETTGVGVTLYFICRDAIAIWREATGRGVAAGRPTVGNGMWVTEITDPDGYRIAFESPTDAPEETCWHEST